MAPPPRTIRRLRKSLQPLSSLSFFTLVDGRLPQSSAEDRQLVEAEGLSTRLHFVAWALVAPCLLDGNLPLKRKALGRGEGRDFFFKPSLLVLLLVRVLDNELRGSSELEGCKQVKGQSEAESWNKVKSCSQVRKGFNELKKKNRTAAVECELWEMSSKAEMKRKAAVNWKAGVLGYYILYSFLVCSSLLVNVAPLPQNAVKVQAVAKSSAQNLSSLELFPFCQKPAPSFSFWIVLGAFKPCSHLLG